ncbi:hypothetical protein H4582DRAFT_1075739 [Lactarius indigo]|nr:hypothetical protein H4582DRAFT_1075739 [Lactarius indigo]
MCNNPHVAGGDQRDVHRDGVPQPVGNMVVQGEMQYPRHIDIPNYNYHPPPPHYPAVPYVHTPRDARVAEAVLAQAHPFTPEVQENYDGLFGYGAQFPATDPDPPDAFPCVWPYPTPPASMLPANGLKNLAGRYLNNPDAHIKILRIEPGRSGHFEV